MTALLLDQWRREAVNPAAQAARCRASAALFDFSFMSVARISGPDASSLISRYVNRDISNMPPGRIRYCLRADSAGKVRSDLTVWRVNDSTFKVMSGEIRDIEGLARQSGTGTTVEDRTKQTAIFAVQGPLSLARMMPVCEHGGLADIAYFEFCDASICGVPALVGRLGYTGERGFEIVIDRAHAQRLWACLSRDIDAAGFAAADILRIEAGFPLFCNEFTIDITPEELALNRFVDPREGMFPGPLSLVCFCATAEQNPVLWQHPEGVVSAPRPGEILVTSACFSPLAGSVMGLGYVQKHSPPTARGFIDPLGQFRDLTLFDRPYFDPMKKLVLGRWDENLQPVPIS